MWITQKKLQLLHQGWPFTCIQSASSAAVSEIQVTPKRLRLREQVPEPQSPEWPRPGWPQEFKDLCKEFEDFLVDELEYAENITCPGMDVELQAGVQPFFARKPQDTTLLGRESQEGS